MIHVTLRPSCWPHICAHNQNLLGLTHLQLAQLPLRSGFKLPVRNAGRWKREPSVPPACGARSPKPFQHAHLRLDVRLSLARRCVDTFALRAGEEARRLFELKLELPFLGGKVAVQLALPHLASCLAAAAFDKLRVQLGILSLQLR